MNEEEQKPAAGRIYHHQVKEQITEILRDFTDPELLQVLRIAEQIKLDREMAA